MPDRSGPQCGRRCVSPEQEGRGLVGEVQDARLATHLEAEGVSFEEVFEDPTGPGGVLVGGASVCEPLLHVMLDLRLRAMDQFEPGFAEEGAELALRERAAVERKSSIRSKGNFAF